MKASGTSDGHRRNPIVRGVVVVAILDLICFVSMIANPDWTDRMIPALIGIQMLGFTVIGFVYWNHKVDESDSAEPQQTSSNLVTGFLPWILGFVVLLLVMQAGLELLAAWGQPDHTHGLVWTVRDIVGAAFLAYVIYRMKRKATKEPS